MNTFTMRLHGSGWLVKDLLNYWNISRKTYERISNDPKRFDELDKKIKAMGVNDNVAKLMPNIDEFFEVSSSPPEHR